MGTQVKVLLLAALFSPVALAAGAHGYTGAENFKNYALSVCVAKGYEAAEVKADASASARGYFELGTLPMEAHTEAVKLAQEFLKREYPSISDEPLTLMKCVDLFHSKELAQIAKKYRAKK